jgi:putative PIN family toxin of toxin-antitoxin system
VRVVFDTNVLLAAVVFPGGQGEKGLRRVIEGQDVLLLSKPILDELLEVLGRKFARDAEELAHVAVFLSDLATPVAPRRRLRIVKDDADNRILECAAAGSAEAIVTGDKALLALKTFDAIPIISLAAYLDIR